MRAFFQVLGLIALMFGGTFAAAEPLTDIFAANAKMIEKPSRQTIEPVIAAIAASGDPAASEVLTAWADKRLGLRKDGQFFLITTQSDGWALRDLTLAPAGTAPKSDITPLKPNSGVRGLIAAGLVQFQLSDPAKRQDALTAIARAPDVGMLAPLRASITGEKDPDILAQKQRLERLLTLQFDPSVPARLTAISAFGSDIALDLRGALNPILATTRGPVQDGQNIARLLTIGRDLTKDEAYDLLVAANLAPAHLTDDQSHKSLEANIKDGHVGGIALAELSDQSARDRAYTALEQAGLVPAAATEADAPGDDSCQAETPPGPPADTRARRT